MLFRDIHTGIALSLWWQFGLLVISLAAYPFDSRKTMGVNPWLKPIKFEISVAIFLITIAVLLSQLDDAYARPDASRTWPLITSAIGWTVAVAMIIENSLIVIQSLRGVRSHMNYSTPLDTNIFGIMAIAILLNTLAVGALLLLYLDPLTRLTWPTAVNVGARLGLAVLIWGSLEGVVMVTNQHHLVGAVDNGNGVPLLNWSTTHGDLRIAHFFGLHAIQIFMLAGFLLSRTWVNRTIQIACMIIFAIVYMGGCYWLFHLAMRGESPMAMTRVYEYLRKTP